MATDIRLDAGRLEAAFRAKIADPLFPCVGAKSAMNRDGLRILVARDIASGWDDLPIHRALMDMAADHRADPEPFRSLVVLFEEERDLDETGFEAHMWDRIQSLSDKDAWLGQSYDAKVSPDPDQPHFSLSFGGEAYFVVGVHPRSSRPARRFEVPAMVFNLHDQFERLREAGRYEKMRDTILTRDEKVAGSINPMLARHGTSSEARQYSGRAVGSDWQCPFSRRSMAEISSDSEAA